MAKSLNELVSDYRKQGGGKRAIVEEIADRVYREPRRYGFRDREEAADALYQFRNRIEKMIDRYVDRGPPFEAYLCSGLGFMARSLHRQQQEYRLRSTVCVRAARLNFEAHEPEPALRAQTHESLSPDGMPPALPSWTAESREAASGMISFPSDFNLPSPLNASETEAMKKRLLFLYLKCAWISNDRDTARLSRLLSIPAGRLSALIGQALRYLEPERRRHEYIISRRDRSWARICLLEERLSGDPDPYQRDEIEHSLCAERLRFKRALFDLRRFRPVVPNSVIAQLLGVPKGTVDSGLYYLRVGKNSPLPSDEEAAPSDVRFRAAHPLPASPVHG